MTGKWVYVPAPWEIPMTFQVGMVGEDGVLLASDRAHSRIGPQTTTSFAGDKLMISGNVAYCCAGDDFTQIVTDEVFRSPRPNAVKTRDFLYQAFSASLAKASNTWKIGGSALMAYDAGNVMELFRIDIYSKDACPMVNPIDNRDYQGDAMNAAAFFLERYLPSNRYKKLPLQRLKLIAAHTLLMASELSPKGIHGLDILLCRPGKPFEMLPPSELDELLTTSKQVDAQIADLLGIPLL